MNIACLPRGGAAQLWATFVEGAETPGTPMGMAVNRAQVLPYLTMLAGRSEPLRIPLVQESASVLYSAWSRTGSTWRLDKTVDGGATYTTLTPELPVVPKCMTKLASGTLLLIEETGTTTPGGSNPKVFRSTDDGGVWAEVAAGLTFPPLSTQGVCEGTDGSVMIGEYGNIGNFVYRIRRSADDGVTWATVYSSSGADSAGDPGHIHSVTYDPYAGKHVAFSDRTIVPGVSGPKVIASSNDGQTWELLGESDTLTKPNFVAPMYFENYIAWGSDNQINGLISRIRRDDFYAGNFDAVEPVVQLDQKAAYFTFPVRPGVWLLSLNVEHIASSEQSGGVGSYSSPVLVVDSDGARVSGGIESYRSTTAVGSNPAVRAGFPSRPLGAFDHDGFCWVSMPIGWPRTYAMVPVSQGWSPPAAQVQLTAIPVLPQGTALNMKHADGSSALVLSRITDSFVTISADVSNSTIPHIRLQDDGNISLRSGATEVARLSSEGFRPVGGLLLAPNRVRVLAGSGSPEGAVTAPIGTLYLNWNQLRGQQVWVKSAGTGNTGWSPVGQGVGNTSERPATAVTGTQYFDTTLGKPIWRTAGQWVDAAGAAV